MKIQKSVELVGSFFLQFQILPKVSFFIVRKKSFNESLNIRATNLSLISGAFYTYSNLQCRIFVEGDNSETSTKSFTNYRLDHVNQTMYLSIIESLPDTFNSSMGYHSHCYKNSIAIQKLKKNTTQNGNKATNRSQLNSPPPSKSRVLPSLCIFCDKRRKRINGQWTLLGKRKERNGNCYSK